VMRGKCKLYGTETELCKSHIIPKFAFDYMKNTGGRFLRSYENPNVRVQDGIKKYLLGEKAEQEFSKRERWFANNMFFPYMRNNQQEFDYDENLAYFITSILWRVTNEHLELPNAKVQGLLFLEDVAEEWRQFLAYSTFPRNYNDLNILLTDRLSSAPSTIQDADLYLSRAIDATVIYNDSYSVIGVYAKFLRFIVWSIVKGEPTIGKNIRVKFTPDKLVLPQEVNDNYFGGFLHGRIQELNNGPKISYSQQNKIIQEIKKNEMDFWNSDAGKSMLNDFRLKNRVNDP
jgi:hypothetical protein